MKLDRLVRVALVAVTVVLGCACSTAVPAVSAAAPSASGTTSLMSAQIAGPAPKVGKAHLAVDEADAIEAASNDDAPKATRRSDGSRRGGGFGTTK
jgi:hypothetical protein